MYALSDYKFELPAELIAQKPVDRRDQSNLLVMDRQSGERFHHRFNMLDHFLRPGDVLVINNTAVIPGRLAGRKDSGGKVEVLICNFNGNCNPRAPKSHRVCECLVKTAKPLKPGRALYFDEGLSAEVLERRNGTYRIRFNTEGDFATLLDRIGQVPLPPISGAAPSLSRRAMIRPLTRPFMHPKKVPSLRPPPGCTLRPNFLKN